MIMASTDPAVTNFWAPVAQIVPVLALALVIEARRYAVHWPEATLRTRRWQSVYLLLVAFIFLSIETWALIAMQTGNSYPVLLSVTPYLLILAFGALSYLPIASFTGLVNADVGDFLEKAAPWSKWRRALRRFDKKVSLLEKDMNELAGDLDLDIERDLSTIQEHEQFALQAEALLQQVSMLGSDPGEGNRLPEGALDAGISSLHASRGKSWAAVEKTRERLTVSYRLRDAAPEHVAQVRVLRRDVEEMKSRKPTPADHERYERLVRRLAFLASEPAFPESMVDRGAPK
ncbi:hypothetical protein [Cryobacterium sp. TMT3-29-2]|uniref:hypothetical protein n=1 Tax=Cryobacterium sp. TMT3-29-2 TaxID=2555867 RepID=UPI0010745202|nr:hypothetical protein [Cryobacterium sp. TMT3-29-2]TFC87133.1 hypothetical protein E3O67_09670 [Cryobacterium sp. TMT3-29-2]